MSNRQAMVAKMRLRWLTVGAGSGVPNHQDILERLNLPHFSSLLAVDWPSRGSTRLAFSSNSAGPCRVLAEQPSIAGRVTEVFVNYQVREQAAPQTYLVMILIRT